MNDTNAEHLTNTSTECEAKIATAIALATTRLNQAKGAPSEVVREALQTALASIPHPLDELPTGVGAEDFLILVAVTAFDAPAMGEMAAPIDALLKLAKRSSNKSLQRRALSIRCLQRRETFQLSLAIQDGNEALQLAIELDDARAQAAVWNNLGLCSLQLGRLSEAAGIFERCFALAEIAGSDPRASIAPMGEELRASALNNLAETQLFLGQPERARASATRAIAFLQEPVGRGFAGRCIAEVHLARALLIEDRLDEAIEHTETAFAFAKLHGSKRIAVAAETGHAALLMHQGRIDEGQRAFERLVTFTREAMPGEYVATLRACIQAHMSAGSAAAALMYFQELVSVKRETGTAVLLAANAHHQPPRLLPHNGADPADEFRAQSIRENLRRQLVVAEGMTLEAEAPIDPTRRRSFRVGTLARLLAEAHGMDEHRCWELELSARLQNIGFVCVPHEILCKPTALSDGERQLFNQHLSFGVSLIAKANLDFLKAATKIVRSHRERWDGTGAPEGLKGEQIPIEARIVAIADAYEAMTHARPWRTQPLSPEVALATLNAEAGTKFDPALVVTFSTMLKSEIWKHPNFDTFLGRPGDESSFVRAMEAIEMLLKAPLARG